MEAIKREYPPHIMKLLQDRYMLRDEEGNLLEDSLEQMFMRVAFTVAQAEEDIDSQTYWSENFLDLMLSNKFLPNTPTLINAGKDKPGCFSACFVLPVEDSMPGIFEAVKQSAIIMKAGGGVGYSFGRLREKGSIVKTTGHKASGPVSFMAAFDSMIDTVAQGGTRRGAAIAVLPCVSRDTKISTLEGNFTIETLVGTRPYLYCTDEQGNIYIRQAEQIWRSGYKQLVHVKLDNHEIVRCTPNHKFLLKNGTYKEAKDLVFGDSLAAFHRRLDGKYFKLGVAGIHKDIYEHWAVAEEQFGRYPEPNEHIHHIDLNPLNNLPDNLTILTKEEHGKLHPETLEAVRGKAAFLRKGLTWEEYYGPEKAESIRQKVKDTKQTNKQIAWNKGLTGENYTEHYEEGFKNQYSNHKVVSVEYGSVEEVYDIAMPDFHNFVANGVFVHNCWHPDIEEFIAMKGKGDFSNFNISIGITDEFMNAIEGDKSWKFISPTNGETTGWIPARDLWNKIIEHAWRTGDPGLVFLNTINKTHPLEDLIEALNPCGEIPLRPYESCNLGSINLMAYLATKGYDDSMKYGVEHIYHEFDYDALAEDIPTMVRFLDDVIDVNPFPLPEIDKASKESRKIGLGVMGWADVLIKMEIPYDSDEAIKLAENLMEFIMDNANIASQDLAREKGAYPLCYEGVDERRNATLLCVAPTGTLSRIAGVSSGIEPIFSWHIHHRLVDLEYDEVHWSLDDFAKSCPDNDLPQYMKTANEIPWQWHLNMQAAFQKYVDNSISKTINLPTNATIDDVNDAYMLAWKYGLKGITIYRDNCKENQPLNKLENPYFRILTEEDGKKYEAEIGDHSKTLGPIIKMALGEGSGVYKGDKKMADFAPEHTPLISKATKEEVALALSDTFPSVEEQIQKYRKRGPVTVGVTHKVDTGKGKIYITINYSEYHAEPVEVFIRLGHASTTNEIALAEWAGRLVSLLLKHNVPLESVIRQGNKVFGDSIFWYNKASFSSFPRLISHLLSFTFEDAMNMAEMDFEAMMENGEEIFEPTYDISGEVTQGYCYQCGSYAIIGEGGCKVCQNCGYENCG